MSTISFNLVSTRFSKLTTSKFNTRSFSSPAKKFNRWESLHKNSFFSVTAGKNGFLPVDKPLTKLPSKYSKINEILDDMVMYKEDGTNGYIYHKKLGEIIDKELPLYNISNETDVKLLAALQRDYYFLASGYSLETAHPKVGDNKYGKARDWLPKQIAVPLLEISKKNNVYPWLDYAYGYCMGNSEQIGDNTKDWNSWRIIRKFNGSKAENGFTAVHTAMVAQTGELLEYQQQCLEAIANDNRNELNIALQKHYEILHNITYSLNKMWTASYFKEYLTFRTFIYGQTGNKLCYPNENIKFMLDDNNNSVELSFRGETGAQDSIIPSIDCLLELEYPKNKLTEYLFDLRTYRPVDHQSYIDFMKISSNNLGFKEYCMKNSKTCIVLLKNLDGVRIFRKKHWNLTKKYIIQNTKHPIATGGTPITTWLPNQLGATLEYMKNVINCVNINELDNNDKEYFNMITIEINDHIQTIIDEVNMMQNEFYDQKHDEFIKEISKEY